MPDSQAAEPLRDEDRHEIRNHREVRTDDMGAAIDDPYCHFCGDPWPCLLMRLLVAYEGREQRIEELEKALAGAPRMLALEVSGLLHRYRPQWVSLDCETNVRVLEYWRDEVLRLAPKGGPDAE